MSRSTSLALVLVVFGSGFAGAEGPPRRAENVIVVTLDGFRPQDFFGGADATLINAKSGGVSDESALKMKYWRDTPEERREVLLPFFWGTIASQGQIFGDASQGSTARVTNGLKFSYPGYNEMFCGFGDSRIDSNDKKINPNVSVLEFLNGKPDFKGHVAAFTTWDVFPYILRSSQNGLKVHAGWVPIRDEPLTARQEMTNQTMEHLPRYWADNVYDVITMQAASEHLARHKPRVLFIGLGETDEWAHGRRYDLYLDAAHQSDKFLSELWATIQSSPEYRDKTAMIVTTDHGRGGTGADWISHGTDVEGAEDLWVAVIGPDTPALGVRKDVNITQSQIAATIAHLIGEDFNAASPKSAPPLDGVSASN